MRARENPFKEIDSDPSAGRGRQSGLNGQRGPEALEALVAGARAAHAAFVRRVESRLDATKASFRRALVLLVVAGLALFIGAVALGVAIVLVILGASEGMASALGGASWIGQLVVGAAVLLGLLMGASVGIARFQEASLSRMKRKYARSEAHDEDEVAPTEARDR